MYSSLFTVRNISCISLLLPLINVFVLLSIRLQSDISIIVIIGVAMIISITTYNVYIIVTTTTTNSATTGSADCKYDHDSLGRRQ